MGDLQENIVIRAVGVVHGSRPEARDDYWGKEVSVIEIDAEQFSEEVIAGLAEFSHLEVVYHMHKVPLSKIEAGARHPRNVKEWPKVGIFGQRAKGRPNRLGVSRCKLVGIDGLRLTVLGLDAIDGTPVIDVKPYMREFGPRGEVKQPEWATEVMRHYYEDEEPTP